MFHALRTGTVPQRSLDKLAVGLTPFEDALDEELERVARGGAVFKAIRGEYGSGKTFFSRWLEERARRLRFVTSEVQISQTETPLHKLQTVYRRLVERLSTSETLGGAFREVLDGWFFTLEEDVLQEGGVAPDDTEALLERTNALMEKRLSEVTRVAPAFAAALRGYRRALANDDPEVAQGLLAWLAGQPHVSSAVKRKAGVKGDVDHDAALTFLQGLLLLLRDAGYVGLLLVLDEVETLQRMRTNVRDPALNGLRQLMDEVSQGRFPGLYVAITGTPAFYDGPQGVQRAPALAMRLHTDWPADPRFDNPRATQIRLHPFNLDRLREVGVKVRDLYAEHSRAKERILELADDAYVEDLAKAVGGELGGKVGIAPRIFLKKLVVNVLDCIDQFPDFDPRKNYALTISEIELNEVERNVRPASDPDEIELDLEES